MIGIPSGYLLIAKIGAVSALLLGVYLTGRHHGETAVQADWDRSKAQFIDAQSNLILQHAREMEDLRKRQLDINFEISQDHQRNLDAIQKKHDADLAAVRAGGGLRVTSAICSGSTSARAEAASNSGHDEDVAGTVQLPDQITIDLFSEAKRADEIVEQARACQDWAKKNGFYGYVPVP